MKSSILTDMDTQSLDFAQLNFDLALIQLFPHYDILEKE